MLTLGASGPAVGAVHQELVEAGEAIAAAELEARMFGESTRAAVERYQRAHGLTADGVVGPRTWAALQGDGGALYTAPGWRWDSTACRPAVRPVVQAAVGEIGVREDPPGSNDSPRIRVYTGGLVGVAWCVYYATWAYQFAEALPLRCMGATWDLFDWAQSRGRLVAAGAPLEPGDLGLILRAQWHGHTFLVASLLADGRIATVEGNAGNAVRGLVRERHPAWAFARPIP